MPPYRDCRQRIIAPSLLAADWSRVAEETSRAIRAGADWLHLDVMDGHFVDNISFGSQFVAAVSQSNDIFLDVHLMIVRPDHFLDRYITAGADGITVHIESDHDCAQTLRRIRAAGLRCGIAIRPETDFARLEPHLPHIDLLLVMTIVPGFGGQKLMPETLETIRAAAAARQRLGLGYHIEVDGGINMETTPLVAAAGANVLVAGTALFGAADMAAATAQMRALGV